MIGLGIDTGGTCTDAVLFDMEKRCILSTGKTATTKEKLEKGIDAALGQLDEELLSRVDLVSLSTTLATNACVEGRGGRVKLLLIGIERKTVEESYTEYGFASMDDFVFLAGEPTEGKEPDFSELEKFIGEFAGCSGIAISQVFAARNDGAYEKKAKEILSQYYSVPIICAYELFSDLNAIKRGAGAYLNARLIPLIEDFLHAVKEVLKKRNLSAPVYIVRSDGSLMNESFTRLHPVETLLCGPAASALGGAYLAKESDALIIDIGGTTTDVAVIRKDILKPVEDGISIGSWKTFVKGMYIDTFGLGGDTALHLYQKNLSLQDFRIMPVCMAAAQYPDLKERILAGCDKQAYSWIVPYEGFVFMHPLEEELDYSENEKALVKALKQGPLLLLEAAEEYGREYYFLDTERLEREGIILRFGLTPTDIMHVRGDFCAYDVETSKAAVEWLTQYLRIEESALLEKVQRMVTLRLYCNLVRILLENGHPAYKDGVPDALMEYVKHTYDGEKFDGIHDCFHTDLAFVGVGAPTHVFLPEVAKKLGAKCVLPENAAVANALGTLAGRVSATKRAEIRFVSEDGLGYEVFLDDQIHFFEECEDAEQLAEEVLKRITGENVIARGGSGEISYVVEKKRLEPDLNYGTLLMGCTVTVTAYAFPKK